MDKEWFRLCGHQRDPENKCINVATAEKVGPWPKIPLLFSLCKE